MAQLREPLAHPGTGATTHVRTIVFRHPAYPDSTPPLLQLGAIHNDGVDYDTAYLSCCIITGNTWSKGWLALPVADGGLRQVERPTDGILRESQYFFCLDDNTSEKYPVHRSFDHWRFPHDDIPHPWSNLAISSAALHPLFKDKAAAVSRDGSCRVTGYVDASEVTHLVPVSAGHWFDSNGMSRYRGRTIDRLPINDNRNLVLLRRDLHRLFDQRRFVFAVKRSSSSDEQLCNVGVHVLPQASLLEVYHNRTVQRVTNIVPEFLFARFAWALFTDEGMPFFNAEQEYAVLTFDPATGQSGCKEMKGPLLQSDIAIFGVFSRRRSTKSKKRPADDDVWGGDTDDENTESTDDDRWGGDTDEASEVFIY